MPKTARLARIVCFFCAAALLFRPAGAAPDPFVGVFTTADGANKKIALTLEQTAADGAYTGIIRLGEQAFPLTAHRDGSDPSQLSGSFVSDGNSFEFTAGFKGGQVALTTGRTTFALAPSKKNPLDAGNDGPAPAASAPAVAAPAAGGAAPPADTLMMRPQMLVDPYPKMNAVSVLVPDKWKLGGQINWVPQGTSVLVDMAVFDPAQHAAWRSYPRFTYLAGVREAAIRQFPPMRAQYEKTLADGTPQGPGEIRTLARSPREYVEKVLVPRLRKDIAAASDVKVTAEKDLPEFAKAQAAAAFPAQPTAAASKFRVTYTASDGPVEEEFVCTLYTLPVGFGPNAWTMWFCDVTSCRAPKDKLDALMPTFATISNSVTVQLPWQNFVTQIGEMAVKLKKAKTDQMIRDSSAHLQVMNDMARQTSAEVSDRIRNNFAEQQKGKAQAHEQFMHYVDNTSSYSNPNDGSRVTLPGNYKYQYVNNRNEIIQTNDPAYQPPADPNTSWQPMQQAK